MNTAYLVGLAALFAAAPARAERPLTYREALQAALDANPALQRSEMGRDQARASVTASLGAFDPTYNLTGFWSRSTSQQFFGATAQTFQNTSWRFSNALSGTAHTGTTVELSQNVSFNEYDVPIEIPTTGGGTQPGGVQSIQLYTGGLSASVTQQLLRGLSLKYNLENVTLARRNLDVAELNYEKQRQETLARAAQAYWNWVYQSALAEIQADAVEVAREALRVGELKVAAGELAPVEKTRLQAALVQAEANAIDTANAAEQAANDLLLVMGEDPDQAVLPATPAGDVPTYELDAERAVQVALEQNLDLAVARANLEIAELQLKNANHGRLPSLSATASVGRTVQDASSTAEAVSYFGDVSEPSVSLSGNLTVPLLNRAARGNAGTQAATVDQRRSELQELERSIAAQVEQQVRQLQSARRRVELADANLALAEQTLAAEEALAAAGRSIQKNVLEARTEVERTRAEAAKARTDYRVARTELLRLQGQLSADIP